MRRLARREDFRKTARMEWQHEGYTVSDDPARLDYAAICDLLWGTYWAGKRARELIEKSLAQSLCFGVYAGPVQIGIARVVTDRATVGYLCDVVISDNHQGKGLGKWLIACILEHPDLQTCRIDLFTRDAQELYQAFGFGPHQFTSLVRYPSPLDEPKPA
jgi:GNAT superfamily N-acetyltransferase